MALDGRWLLDPEGDRHAEAGHPIEDVAANLRLGPLVGQSPGVETSTDDRLVTEHGGLDEAAAAVAGLSLPPSATMLLDPLDVLVPLACRRFSWDSGRTRRDDDIGFGMTRRHGIVDWLSVISAISDHGIDRPFHLIEQVRQGRDIARFCCKV